MYRKEPYESSKWATDLISIRSTERFKQENKKITSFSASPGVVASEIGNLPRWIIMARFVLHYVVSITFLTILHSFLNQIIL